MRKAASITRFRAAEAADDAELRRLMREIPMSGAIRVAFLREPSFFAALQVEGTYTEAIICRDPRAGAIVGLGNRSVKPVYVNGVPSVVGYLSSLRLLEPYRSGTLLAAGYRFLRERHKDKRTPLYLSTVIEGNTSALRILTSRRAGLPAYHDFGRFYSVAIGLRQRVRSRAAHPCDIRRATPADVTEIIDFLNREGRRRQFFPRLTAEHLHAPEGLLRGLNPENVLMARVDGEIVGTVAAWDQKAFRQSMITGYSAPWRLVRPLYNRCAPLLGYPALPQSLVILNFFCLGLVCIKENNRRVFEALLDREIELHHSSYDFMMVGVHERDALLDVVRQYRHVPYKSRLFVVFWEDGQSAFECLDDRVPYLELGAL